jgi:hypothetical protein
MAKRKDSVKEYDGGWYGVHDENEVNPKAPPKRMFRTREEAEALDSLLMVANGRGTADPGKKS